jgi:hypothetical protein
MIRITDRSKGLDAVGDEVEASRFPYIISLHRRISLRLLGERRTLTRCWMLQGHWVLASAGADLFFNEPT